MGKKPASEPSSLDVFRTLQWLRKNEFKPVPLHFKSKAPAIREWMGVDYKPPGDDFWTVHNYGVGCLTGAPDGPVDIDLDSEEAVFFAPYFLPKTSAVFGRKSKPRSHYLYRVVEPLPYRRYARPTVPPKVVLEIRSGQGGQQTMFPGSTHPCGEVIQWANEPDPELPQVTAEELIRGSNRVMLATLLVNSIWGSGSHHEPTKFITGALCRMKWSLEDIEQLIQAMMDWDGDSDKSRMPTVRGTYNKIQSGVQKITGAPTMRKAINDEVVYKEIMELAGSPFIVMMNEYNEHYAVVRLSDKFRIACFDVSLNDPPQYMTKKDFLDWKAPDLIKLDDEDKTVPKAALWLANRERRTYHSVDFLPGTEAPPGVLNLWTGWGVQPSKDGSCDGWLTLLREAVCCGDEQLYVWMLNWFANIVRAPLDKPLTAPVIIGKQGAGKTLLLTYFGRILGKGYTVVTKAEHIHGKHNAHLQHTLLLHSEEAIFGGDRKHLSDIKSLITDEYQQIEPKGVNSFRVKSFVRVALTSNEMRAAPVESGDRRFTVADMGDRVIGDELAKVVDREKYGGGPARLFQFLLDMKHDPAVVRTNIKNQAMADMKAQNRDPVENWWYDTLMDGAILPDELRVWAREAPEFEEQKEWPPQVSSRALHVALLMRWQNQRVYGTPPTEALLALRLDKFIGVKLERVQMRGYVKPERFDNDPPLHPLIAQLSDRQYTITNLPPLEQCRKAYETYVGQPIEWPKVAPPHALKNHEKF